MTSCMEEKDIEKLIEEEARNHAYTLASTIKNADQRNMAKYIADCTINHVIHLKNKEIEELKEALSRLLYLSQDLINDLDAWDKDYPEINITKQILKKYGTR